MAISVTTYNLLKWNCTGSLENEDCIVHPISAHYIIHNLEQPWASPGKTFTSLCINCSLVIYSCICFTDDNAFDLPDHEKCELAS
jgi:hypothetical protein